MFYINTKYFNKLINEKTFNIAPYELNEMYLGLGSSLPTLEGTNYTEPSGSLGYTRTKMPIDDTIFEYNDTEDCVENKNKIVIPSGIGLWENIAYWMLFDKETNGNLLAYGELDKTYTIIPDVIFILLKGNLKFKIESIV